MSGRPPHFRASPSSARLEPHRFRAAFVLLMLAVGGLFGRAMFVAEQRVVSMSGHHVIDPHALHATARECKMRPLHSSHQFHHARRRTLPSFRVDDDGDDDDDDDDTLAQPTDESQAGLAPAVLVVAPRVETGLLAPFYASKVKAPCVPQAPNEARGPPIRAIAAV